MYNFICLCMSYEFDLQQKQTTKGKIDFLSTIKRSYCPLSPIPPAVLFYDTTLSLSGLDGYVLLIQGGDHFTLQSFEQGVCLGCGG